MSDAVYADKILDELVENYLKTSKFAGYYSSYTYKYEDGIITIKFYIEEGASPIEEVFELSLEHKHVSYERT